MPAKSALQEKLSELTSKLGAGLLGKITPFFITAIAFGVTAIWVLPESLKLHAFWYAVAVTVVYSLLASFIILVHPILGTLDGKAARDALRDEMTAKNTTIIQGSSSPVALSNAEAGIGGPTAMLSQSKGEAR